MAKISTGNKKIVITIVILCIIMLCLALVNYDLNDILADGENTNNSLLVLQVPNLYSPLMSSVPGLKIQAVYKGNADQIKYTTDFGSLSTWKGKVTQHGKTVTLPLNELVYWSPLEESKSEISREDNYIVKAEVIKEGKKVVEQSVLIKRDSDTLMYYPVEDLPNVVIVDITK